MITSSRGPARLLTKASRAGLVGTRMGALATRAPPPRVGSARRLRPLEGDEDHLRLRNRSGSQMSGGHRSQLSRPAERISARPII